MKVTPSDYGYGTFERGFPDRPEPTRPDPADNHMSYTDVRELFRSDAAYEAAKTLGLPIQVAGYVIRGNKTEAYVRRDLIWQFLDRLELASRGVVRASK